MIPKTQTIAKPKFLLLGGISSLPGASVIRRVQAEPFSRKTDYNTSLEYHSFRAFGVTPQKLQKKTRKA